MSGGRMASAGGWKRPRSIGACRISRLLCLAIALATSAGAGQPLVAQTTAILAGRLIDGRADEPLLDQVILIDGDRITHVGPRGSVEIPADAWVIDLVDHTVMPGLIDVHTHLTAIPELFNTGEYMGITPPARALRSVENARATLLSGFTTVRDVGAASGVDLALRDAIAAGHVVGPRMRVSALPLSITGGGMDANGVAPEYTLSNPFAHIVDGPDAVRLAVRTNRKRGADWIKIYATGAIGASSSDPEAVQFSHEELRVAVEEAHALGMRVAAHAHGTRGIRNAVEAGAASIEHGSLLDDQTIAVMKARGTWLVPDLYGDEWFETEGRDSNAPAEQLAKNTALSQRFRDSARRAHAAGVRIAFGSDSGVYPFGLAGRQFALMLEIGMTPMEAIRAATADAAEMLGMERQIGTVEAGKIADLVAVRGDPIADVRLLENVQFVVRDGIVYKMNGEAVVR